MSIVGAEVGLSSSTSQLARCPYDGQEYSSRVKLDAHKVVFSGTRDNS